MDGNNGENDENDEISVGRDSFLLILDNSNIGAVIKLVNALIQTTLLILLLNNGTICDMCHAEVERQKDQGAGIKTQELFIAEALYSIHNKL